MSTKNRDYLFDNYKALLIFLVVIGHFVGPCNSNNAFFSTLKWIIVSFHMPAFIFISGYFSKRELPMSVLIKKLAVPYLVYEVVYYLFYTFVIHKKTGLYLLYPKFTLWYLLALFIWRAITPLVKKIPYHMALSIIAGLLIGCSTVKGNFISISRVAVFYPFFLAGMYFNREIITQLRNRKNQILAGVSVALCALFVGFGPLTNIYTNKIFYGRYSYEALGQSPIEGILCRILCYLIGFFFTFALMFLISEKQTFYSYIGPRTMSIYLFHGLTYQFLKSCTSILKNVDTIGETALLLVFCAALTALFSAPQFTTFTSKISNLPLPDLSHLFRAPSYLYYPGSLTAF